MPTIRADIIFEHGAGQPTFTAAAKATILALPFSVDEPLLREMPHEMLAEPRDFKNGSCFAALFSLTCATSLILTITRGLIFTCCLMPL